MQSKKTAEKAQEQEFLNVESLEILRATEGKKGLVFFDMRLNGIYIYGMSVVSGRTGDFISWPSRKGSDGNYYKYAYAPLREETLKSILGAVQDKLDE